MPNDVARVLCAVTLRVELWDQGQGPEDRLAAETAAMTSAVAISAGLDKGYPSGAAPVATLDPTAAKFVDEDHRASSPRPHYEVVSVRPMKWAIVYNSFRKADELEVTLPLDAFPVPLDSVRVVSCIAVVDHVSSDRWVEMGSNPTLGPRELASPDDADFAGVCTQISQNVSNDGVPSVRLRFIDYVGLLASKSTSPDASISENVPISKSIEAFLRGTPAEGLTVVWTDPESPEPTVATVTPEAKKVKRGKTAKTTAFGNQKYLDVISQVCGKMGIVPRVNVSRLELAYAGTMYEGRDRNGNDPKATILVGQIVESFDVEHQLLGSKIQSVGVMSYNPDTGELYTARWPPDPKKGAPVTVKPGQRVAVIPLTANVGLPGYDQLDESVVMVPIAPVADAAILPKIAQAIFLERNRQKVYYTLRTHSPWSNPDQTQVADILKLRAGDNVAFGVVVDDGDPSRRALLPAPVRVLSGDVGADGIASLLRQAGVPADDAKKAGASIARVPRLSRWRVDEMRVSGGADQDAEIELKIVNFTIVTADLETKATGKPVNETLKVAIDAKQYLGLTIAQVNARFAAYSKAIDDSEASDATKNTAKAQLVALQRQVLAGK